MQRAAEFHFGQRAPRGVRRATSTHKEVWAKDTILHQRGAPVHASDASLPFFADVSTKSGRGADTGIMANA